MAEDVKNKLADSHLEDYDPLKDYFSSGAHEFEPISELSPDSPFSSVDSNAPLWHCITPPILKREVRREKEKLSTCRERKSVALKDIVIKDTYHDRGGWSSLNSFDSTDDLAESIGRERRERTRKNSRELKKSLYATRSHDRLLKQQNVDDLHTESIHDVSPLNQIPLTPVQVNVPNHYSTVTKPLSLDSSANAMAFRRNTRTYSVSQGDCPNDRYRFFTVLSSCISLGSNVMNEKEKKGSRYSRQLSWEEELIHTQLHDVLWLNLHAYLNNRTMQEQTNVLLAERAKVPSILSEVVNFKLALDNAFFNCGLESASCLSKNLRSPPGSFVFNSSDPASPEVAAVVASFHTITLTDETVCCQKQALIQVTDVLNKLEHCERLYPSCKHLASANKLYDTESFKKRVSALCLWLNITRDLSHKIKLIGKVLGVEKIAGINWPWINVPGENNEVCEQPFRFMYGDPNINVHRNSIPEICQPMDYRHLITPPDSNDVSGSDSAITSSDSNPNLLSSPDKKTAPDTPSGGHPQNFPLRVIIPRHVQFHSLSEKTSRSCTPVILEDPTSVSGRSTPTKPLNLMLSKPVPTYQTLSRVSSELSLSDMTRTSVYRHFVDKSLKKMGMQKLWLRLRDLLDRSLQRAKEVLEQHQIKNGYVVTDLDPAKEVDHKHVEHKRAPDLTATSDSTDSNPDPAVSTSPEPQELFKDVNWNQEFIDAGLPSFRASYLFLSRIPLDVMHECLRLRLEQKPTSDPSFLSIRQLIRECKEVLSGAVSAKQYYQFRVSAVLYGEETAEDNLVMDLEQFDADMARMFEVYFQYIQTWMYSLQSLPEASRSLKNALEEEWSFTKRISPHVIGGEAEAGKRFSTLATSLINSIADFLETGIDECTRHLYDITMDDPDDDDVTDGDLNDAGADEVNGYELTVTPDDGYEEETEETDGDYARHLAFRHKQSIQKTCREFKNLFYEARERASKAIGFAKMLRKDLEIASEFSVAVPMERLMDQLKITGHIRVQAPVSIGYLMFIPDTVVDERTHVLQLLNVTCRREEVVGLDPNARSEGYLLMVKCESGTDHVVTCPVWTGANLMVEPTAETTIALSHINVDSLLLVVTHSSHLEKERRDFESLMGKTINLINEQTSCHQKITESLAEVKVVALDLQEKVVASIKQLDERLTLSENPMFEENDRIHIVKLCRETILQCYNFGFEYHKEIVRLMTGETRLKLGRRLISFAINWITFVVTKCEKGRGKRPRWATQGLDFLITACEPRVLTNLPEKDFQDLRIKVDNCISHVIGIADKTQPRQLLSYWTPTMDTNQRVNRMLSWPDTTSQRAINRSASSKSANCEPLPLFNRSPELTNADQRSRKSMDYSTSPYSDIVRYTDYSPETDTTPKSRGLSMSAIENDVLPFLQVHEAIEQLERLQEEKLVNSRVIGRVTNKTNVLDYHVSVRRVNFRWQRGIKIGEGQFGKVYTGVNMDTGELMAIKELKCHYNDQRAFKLIADELCNLEGIQHTNLLRYYGVEMHRDEMLIFMEYCDRGTIEDAARLGLPEFMIRQYTRDLLLAVSVIHERGIIHRDIKGANIFLTSRGSLKLGDFGCSVKLKSHMTLPGEINSLVGSTAFMAPEVIMKNDQEGHGRAADVWSLGCVVIEMATGKRPWHELENNYQIMFKVGMGGTPSIPDNLSSEGKDFLEHCFEVDPKLRWTAYQLRDHAFVKVYEEAEESDMVKH